MAATVLSAIALAAPLTPADPLEPTTDPSSALVSPLRIVTVATGDPSAALRFYRDGAGMTVVQSGAMPVAGHRSSVTIFARPGLDGAVAVRSVAVGAERPQSRPGYDATLIGALAMGMPLHGQKPREAAMTAAGFRSAAGVTSMTLPRGDGTTYTVEEIHYRAPDGVLVLGIDRGPMTPVGPVDARSQIGGPAYSSMVIDDAAKTAPFFRDVLGYELRREFTFTSSGPQGGLGLPEGTRIRFQQWYAPGARTGYVILMDLLNAGGPPAAPLGLGSRGIAMWSFETKDLAEIARRAKAAGAKTLAPAARADLPGAGKVRALTLATPDGFPIEIYQRSGS